MKRKPEIPANRTPASQSTRLESEIRFRAIFENSGSGMALMDLQGFPIQSNPAFQNMLGYTEEELKRTAFDEFTHAEDRTLDSKLYRELVEGRRDKYDIEKRFIRKDGSVLWGQSSVSLIRDDQGVPNYAVCTVQDITTRKQAEERINLLQTITMDVAAAEDLPAALEVVLRRVCEKTGWALGQAWVPNQEGAGLDCCPAWFATLTNLEDFRAFSSDITLASGIGLPGRVWASRQPVWVRDVTLDSNFPRAEVASRCGLKAALGVPILSGSEVIAVLEFFLREPREEDERLVKVIATVADQIGLTNALYGILYTTKLVH